jgi:hypothetical protein
MGMSGFAGSGQAAHDDESRGRIGLIHNRLLLAALFPHGIRLDGWLISCKS